MDQTACNHLKPDRINPTSDDCHPTGIVTPLVDRLGANLLEPIMLSEGEYGNWVKRHVCAMCGARLLTRFGPGRTWIPRCPAHGDIHEGQYCTPHQWKQAEQGMRAGMLEMHERKAETVEDILKSMGF